MFSIRALKRRDGFTLDVAIEVAERGVIGLFGHGWRQPATGERALLTSTPARASEPAE